MFVTGNTTVTANYTRNTYTVTLIQTAGELTISAAGGPTYYLGDTSTIMATPLPGFKFASWAVSGGTVSGETGDDTLTVEGNVTLSAVFTPLSYSGTETMTGGTIILSNSGPYLYGEVITATASAQAGYLFDGWSVTGPSTLSDSSAASTSLTVYDNFTLTASFTQETFTVTAATSTTWVYQNTPSVTMDRHALTLTISATDTWGNHSYTVTVTQTGPGVVTPTQTQTNSSTSVLVTPTMSLTWTQAAADSMTCYLVGGRADGWVNSVANLNLTGSCTVTVTVVGDVSRSSSATATVTIYVRPLGDLLNAGPINSLDVNEFVNWLDGHRGDTSTLDPEVFDIDGSGQTVSSLQLNLLILMLNGHVIP
jgi:hypothetical protein